MGKSTAGYILGLIGGILGTVIGIIILSYENIIVRLLALNPFTRLSEVLTAMIIAVVGVWYIISAALVIWFSTWMKNPKKCRAGGIWTLVLSIVGAGGILGIIGGIFGIVKGGK